MTKLEKILEEIEKHKHIVTIFGREIYFVPLEAVKQIIRKHMNDGWIPVEERLPEEDGFYLCTMDGKIVGEEEPFTGLSEFENGLWIDDDIDYRCIIAWRPLPEPYRTEKEV